MGTEEEIAQVVSEFIDAENWAKSQLILEANDKLLLSDQADAILADAIVQFREKPEVYDKLKTHRDLLSRCREIGIEDAFSELMASIERRVRTGKDLWDDALKALGLDEKLLSIIKALLSCKNPHAVLNLIIKQPDLLEEDTLGLVQAVKKLADSQDDEKSKEIAESLTERLHTLFEIKDRMAQMHQEQDPLFETLQVWTSISDRDMSQEFLANHPVLLTDRAEELLRGSAEGAEVAGDKYAAHFILHWLNLLKRCRKFDIKTTFGEFWTARRTSILEGVDTLARQAVSLNDAYARNGEIAFLEETIRLWEEILYHPDFFFGPLRFQLFIIVDMGSRYIDRYNATGNWDDLERAIKMWRVALTMVTRRISNSEHGLILSTLADGLRIRYEALRQEQDLEEATEYGLLAVNQWSDDSPIPPAFLASLGGVMLMRYEVYNQLEDLETSVEVLHRAVNNSQDDSPELPARLTTLGLALRNRYSKLGQIDDLEMAVNVQHRAIMKTLDESPALKSYLNNLATTLVDRSVVTGSSEDLDEAIKLYRQAILLTQLDSPDLPMFLSNLGVALRSRYVDVGQLTNLLEAVEAFDKALELLPADSFYMPLVLTNLGLALNIRSRVLDRPQDIDLAIKVLRKAVESTPVDSVSLHGCLNCLGNTLHDRFYIENDPADLEEAIKMLHAARDTSAPGDINRPFILNNLGEALVDRFNLQGNLADLDMARLCFEDGLSLVSFAKHPEVQSRLAYNVGRLYYREGDFTAARKSLLIAHKALEILRGGAPNTEGRRRLADRNADMYAHLVFCCLHLDDIELAFECAAAAKGRIFIDTLAAAKIDLETADVSDPVLAKYLDKLLNLRAKIDTLSMRLIESDMGGFINEHLSPTQIAQSLEILRKREKVLWEELTVRYPALAATQATPALTAKQAMTLARETQATLVDYYEHSEGWGTFIITPDAIQYIQLPFVHEDLLLDMEIWVSHTQHRYGQGAISYRFLHRLYQAFITPLVDQLPKLGRRLVLSPFSWAHLLPLAAGFDPDSGHYADQQYLLAFAPSLGALKATLEQSRIVTNPFSNQLRKILIVAYPGLPGAKHYLPNVLPEAEAIAAFFPEVTKLYGKEATTKAFIQHAAGQPVIHLGCHGWFDPEEPENSGLLLSDGWLNVNRVIRELRMDSAQLVTLGACLSGTAQIDRGDNFTGLMQAVLSTGVSSVAASLWSVHDTATRLFFEKFYTLIANGYAPARALQIARLGMQDASASWHHPYYWAAFQINGLAFEDAEKKQDRVVDFTLPIKSMVNANVRGGHMSKVEIVRQAEVLLEQMLFYFVDMRDNLSSEEQGLLLATLPILNDQARSVRSEAELFALANAVHVMVEEVVGLRQLLVPKDIDVETARLQRAFKPEDLVQDNKVNAEAQRRAAIIANTMGSFHDQLTKALTESPPVAQGKLSKLWMKMGIKKAKGKR